MLLWFSGDLRLGLLVTFPTIDSRLNLPVELFGLDRLGLALEEGLRSVLLLNDRLRSDDLFFGLSSFLGWRSLLLL